MFIVDAAPTNSGSEENSPPNVATAHKEWLQERYRDALRLVLASFTADRIEDGTQALVTAVRLIGHEGRYPLDQRPNAGDNYYFPVNRFRNILQRLLASDRPNRHLLNRFKEYGQYLDVLHYAWKLLPGLTMKGKSSTSDIYIQNYLDLVAAIPIKADVLQSQQYLCYDETTATVGNAKPLNFDYATVRKCLNKSWQCTAIWKLTAQTQKQMLILLLEHVMSQLDKPVLLTDFLMDSLDVGGPISLLALQGVFTLIQQHNLTYPNIYEKLYSMFEPEIFHTKFKARLFYLADIFLSSISLPEMLVAAFVKRLARLSLVAPPQDIVIILYFIGNLIIRHPGLKRLICHPDGGQVVNDPYVMGEMEPIRSMALDSSLWEVVLLQNHAMPSIAQAARFISAPLPTTEWDLSNFLELNEDDVSSLFSFCVKHAINAFVYVACRFLTNKLRSARKSVR